MYKFVFLFFFLSPVYAHYDKSEEQDSSFNIKLPHEVGTSLGVDQTEDGHTCGGYVRAGFIQTDNASASALAGKLGCDYQFNPLVKVKLGVFASFDPGLNSHNDNNVQGDFFNQKKDSYLIVGEAVLNLSYGDFDARLGRQTFDSPHMDADDLRMIPNLFEAYLVDYQFSDEIVLGTGYVREASGWENGANASQFVAIGEAFGGEDNGAWVSWLNFEKESLTADAWFYYVPDHLTIFYTELVHSQHLSDDLAYSFGLQYDWGKDSGQEKLGHIDSHTVGVMGSLEWTDFTFTVAYNKNFGDTGTIASIGGGPYFTSVEELTLDAVAGVDTESVLVNLEYDLNDEITFGAAASKFSASNKNDFNQEELNLYANYNWDDKVVGEVMYAVVDDVNTGPDLHQIRVILTYSF